MIQRNQKLELASISRENQPNVEPRTLLKDPEKSNQANLRVTGQGFFESLLALYML